MAPESEILPAGLEDSSSDLDDLQDEDEDDDTDMDDDEVRSAPASWGKLN